MGGPQKPSLVIFDCDGVLVDSERLASVVLSAVLSEYGLDLSSREVEQLFRGRSLADCMRQIEATLGRPLGDNFLAVLNNRTYDQFKRELRPIPGAREVVHKLERMGVQSCVASSGSHEKIELTLSLTGLLSHFRGRIYSATEVPRGKPAPDLVLHAARCAQVPPRECVVIEDSRVGAEGALSAGMAVLGFVDERMIETLEVRRNEFQELGVPTFYRMQELPGLLGL